MLDREEPPMPTTQPDNAPENPFLSAVRESQAAVIDVLRAWTDIGQQVTRDLRPPVARIDLADAVDRVFDVAEQTLAAQREFARALAGAATRQLDSTVDTLAETADTAVEAEPPTQDRPADRRSYEDRSVEELRERARELEIEGRSTMTKDELIAALRRQAR
jgi:Rho termination factor, N-terminal domain